MSLLCHLAGYLVLAGERTAWSCTATSAVKVITSKFEESFKFRRNNVWQNFPAFFGRYDRPIVRRENGAITVTPSIAFSSLEMATRINPCPMRKTTRVKYLVALPRTRTRFRAEDECLPCPASRWGGGGNKNQRPLSSFAYLQLYGESRRDLREIPQFELLRVSPAHDAAADLNLLRRDFQH